MVGFAAWFLTLTHLGQIVWGAPPPDLTYFLTQELQNSGAYVHLVESRPSMNASRLVFDSAVGVSNIDQFLVLGAGVLSDPAALTVSLPSRTVYLLNTSKSFFAKKLAVSANTLALKEDGVAIAADGVKNDIFTIDVLGNISLFMQGNVLDPARYGLVRRLQMIGPRKFVALTQNRLLVVDTAGVTPKIDSEIDLRAFTYSNEPFSHSVDMVAGPDAAWVLLRTLDRQNANILRGKRAVYFKYAAGRPGYVGPDYQHYALELLDMEAGSGDLLARYDQGIYMRFAVNQPFKIEDQNFFSLSNVAANAPKVSKHAAVLIDHHKSALTWVSRAGGAVRAVGPAFTSPSGSSSGVLAEPVGPDEEIDGAVSEDDFRKLMIAEIGAPQRGGGMDAERFANFVNATEQLKYYLGLLTSLELKAFGLERRGAGVFAAIAGAKSMAISLDSMTGALSQARRREISLKRCESKMTKS